MPAGRAGNPLGLRSPRGRHGINENCRIDRSCIQSLWGFQGRSGHHRPGVRTILRPEGRCFPRRLPDGSVTFRRRASRLSLVPRQGGHPGKEIHDLRLQGQAGPRQDSQRRRDRAHSRHSPTILAPARSTTSAEAATTAFPCSKPSARLSK